MVRGWGKMERGWGGDGDKICYAGWGWGSDPVPVSLFKLEANFTAAFCFTKQLQLPVTNILYIQLLIEF